jgi:hypothetical protein
MATKNVKLSPAQRNLLRRAKMWETKFGEHLSLEGQAIRTARALEKKGLGRVAVGGSGVAYKGNWWLIFITA